MLFLNEPHLKDPGLPSRRDIRQMVRWNLWQTRQSPYNDIEAGEPIVLVDSWPAGSRLTWLTQARKVVKSPYSTREDAARVIANEFGLQINEVLENEYTLSRPSSGQLLVLSFSPQRELAQARPKCLRFRPNGWARLEDRGLLAEMALND